MRVLITGGKGLIGKATAERLIEKGWDVRLIDLQPEAAVNGAEYIPCDILNYDELLKQMRGCDAVIHMAAIRSPNLAPGHEIFEINAAGTFNVFEAAAASGIGRVVQASSINALGCFYGIGGMDIAYFPVDEAHPTHTTDPYSFSKGVVEDIGAYYWRRDGISSVAMRYPGVYDGDFARNEDYLHKRETVRQMLDELASLPEPEMRARIDAVKARVLEFRSHRPFEFKPDQPKGLRRPFFDDPLFWMYAGDRFNFWSFIDVRDAAQSLEKGCDRRLRRRAPAVRQRPRQHHALRFAHARPPLLPGGQPVQRRFLRRGLAGQHRQSAGADRLRAGVFRRVIRAASRRTGTS